MTDEKICPFMSRCEIQPDGDHLLATTYCQKERCMAWGEIGMNGSKVEGCRLIKSEEDRNFDDNGLDAYKPCKYYLTWDPAQTGGKIMVGEIVYEKPLSFNSEN